MQTIEWCSRRPHGERRSAAERRWHAPDTRALIEKIRTLLVERIAMEIGVLEIGV
jgi:hypothetical protein